MIPPVIFGDASFYIALFSVRDLYHDRAVGWPRALAAAKSRIVTTEHVLWEVLDGLSALGTRATAMQGYRLLHRDAGTEIVEPDPLLMAEALAMYDARRDKEWGITDCLSFVVMQRWGLSAALTADHHFEQAGFEALLLILDG